MHSHFERRIEIVHKAREIASKVQSKSGLEHATLTKPELHHPSQIKVAVLDSALQQWFDRGYVDCNGLVADYFTKNDGIFNPNSDENRILATAVEIQFEKLIHEAKRATARVS